MWQYNPETNRWEWIPITNNQNSIVNNIQNPIIDKEKLKQEQILNSDFFNDIRGFYNRAQLDYDLNSGNISEQEYAQKISELESNWDDRKLKGSTLSNLAELDLSKLDDKQREYYELASKQQGYNLSPTDNPYQILALNQHWSDKWANGILKFAGKTLTNVVGSTLGIAYGLVNMLINGDFQSFYNNDFQKVLDQANKAMDDYLPNYISRQEQEYGLLRSLGTANFWANDFLGGMSFVAGAVISELLTSGIATALIPARAAKMLKYTSTADDIARAYQRAANPLLRGTKEVGNFVRQMAVGAGYEASVEANHFIEQAKQDFINHIKETEGREVTDIELAQFMDSIAPTANALFGTNLALVSINNMITLPKSFAPKVSSNISKNIKKTSELSDNQLERVAKRMGVSEDEVKKLHVVNKELTKSKLRKGIEKTAKILEKPLAEGVWEEGMQGTLNSAALEYAKNFYDPEYKKDAISVAEAMISGLEEAYGTKEGQKEILIGALLGLIGFAGPSKKGGIGWQGGITDIFSGNNEKMAQTEALVNLINNNKDLGVITKPMIKASLQALAATKEMDEAADLGDMFRYKNAENTAFASYVMARTEAGLYDEINDNIAKQLEQMSEEEFASEFGYTNLTKEELAERKQEVIKKLQTRAKEVRDAYVQAKAITKSDDLDLNFGLGWTISSLKNLDEREQNMFNYLRDKVGVLIDNKDLKRYIELGLNLEEANPDKIKNYRKIIAEIEKSRRELSDKTYSLTWKGEGKSLIKDRNTIENLEKEINNLLKQKKEAAKEISEILKRGHKLEYENDIDALEQDLDLFIKFRDDVNKQAQRPLTEDVSQVYEDLKRIAKYREKLISEYNFLLTKEGQESFLKSLELLNELDQKERLFDEIKIAATQLPDTKKAKIRDLQETAFRVRGNYMLGLISKEKSNQEDTIEEVTTDAINSFAKSMQQSSPESEATKFAKETMDIVNGMIKDKKPLEEILKVAKQKLKELEKNVQNFSGTQLGDEYRALYESNVLQNFITKLEKQIKDINSKKSPHKLVPIISKPSQLYTVKPDIDNPNAIGILENLHSSDIEYCKGLTITLEDDEEGGNLVDPTDIDGNIVQQGVKIRKGFNGEKKQLVVKYNGQKIGYLYDYNRYQFDDGNGNYRDFNGSVQDLERLNPDFIKIEDGQKVPSEEGLNFINTYNELKKIWSVFGQYLLNNPGSEISSDELNEKFYANYTISFNTEEDLIPLSNIINDTSFYTYDENGNKIRPVIYNKQYKTFFVYDEQEGKYVLVKDKQAIFFYEKYYKPNFEKIKNLFNQYVVFINKTDDQVSVLPVSLKYKEIDDSVNLVSKIFENFEEFKQSIDNQLVEILKKHEDDAKAQGKTLDFTSPNLAKSIRDELQGYTVPLGFFPNTNKYHIEFQFTRSSVVIVPAKSGNEKLTRHVNFSPVLKISRRGRTIGYINLTDSKLSVRLASVGKSLMLVSDVKGIPQKVIKTNEDFIEALNIIFSEFVKSEANSKLGLRDTTLFMLQEPAGEEFNIEGKIEALDPSKIEVYPIMSNISFRPKNLKFESKSSKEKQSSDTNEESKKEKNDVIEKLEIIERKLADLNIEDEDHRRSIPQIINLIESLKPTGSEYERIFIEDKKRKLINFLQLELQKYEDEQKAKNQGSTPKHESDEYKKDMERVEELNRKINELNDKLKEEFNKGLELKKNDPSIKTIVEALKRTNYHSIRDERDQYERERTYIHSKYEEPIFKIDSSNKELINLENAFENLKRILPEDVISFKELDTIKQNILTKGQTVGAFFNKVIYLSKLAGKGTEYHEAFHAVLRTFLTKKQLEILFKAAEQRYGKPTQEELEELRNQSPHYQNLSKRQLTLIWYEEKLADEFQSYALKKDSESKGIKGFIRRVFEKLKKLINWVNNNKLVIDELFEGIYSGSFKTAKPTGAFPIFFGTEVEVYKLIRNKRNNNYFTSSLSLNIYNRIVKELLTKQKKGEVITDEVILEEIFNVAINHYNPGLEKYTDPILRHPSSMDKYTQIEDVYISLTSMDKQEEQKIIEEVKKKLNSIKFETNENELEDKDDDTPTEFGIKDTRSVGGLGSTSKQMREYMSFIEMPIDEFELGLTEEELSSGNYNGFVDPQELYTSVEAMMTNTPREKMLKKLYEQSKNNRLIYYFYNTLISDIKNELNKQDYSDEDILNLPVSELAKSAKYGLFISNFNKYKQLQVTTLADPTSGHIKVFRTNMYDVQDKQVEKWASAWRYKSAIYENFKDFALEHLEKINLLLSINYTDILQIDTASNLINTIQQSFDAIGISLSKSYIKYVLLDLSLTPDIHTGKSKFDEVYNLASEEQKAYLDELLEFYDLFTNVPTFSSEDILGIIESLKYGSPYLKDNTVTAIDEFTEEDGFITKEMADTLGAIGRLKNIALGNSYFDESVGSTTVQNAEGETQYTHIAPNYFIVQTLSFQDENNRNWALIEDEHEAFEALKKSWEAQNKSFTEYQLKTYFHAVRNNPLLRGIVNKTIGENRKSEDFEKDNPTIIKFIFKEFRTLINDGLRREHLKLLEQGDETFVVSEKFRGSEGNLYADLDERATLYTMLAYFADQPGNNFRKVKQIPNSKVTIETALFIPLHIEAKNTQIAVEMPVNSLTSDTPGVLNKTGLELAKTFFKQEYDRISRVSRELQFDEKVDKIENYNTSENSRGLDFFNFKKLESLDNVLYRLLVEEARQGKDLIINKQLERALNEFFENEFKEFLDLLKDLGMISENEDGYKNLLLPLYYSNEDGTLNLNNLSEFFFNHYFNSLSYTNLMFGDLAVNFKNPVDFVKRMAGANAAGPSLGYGKSKIAIIPDQKTDSGINRTDGQSYGSIDWYIKNYLPSLGKNSKAVAEIYKKIKRGESLSRQEVEVLRNEGALVNPRKTVVFDTFIYGKTSTKILIRSEVSRLKNPEDRKKVNRLYDILETLNTGTEQYNNVLNIIHSYWEPIPGREVLHERLNNMERQDVSLVFHASAIKGAITNLSKDETNYNTLEINNQFIREQVVTDNLKDTIVHGTQMMQLLISEQNDSVEVLFNGKPVKIRELKEYYKNLLGERVIKSFELMRKSIMEGNIPRYKYLLKSFESSIIESGSDPVLLEYFRAAYESADMPEYNLNLPSIVQKFENMFLAYVGKGTFQQKSSGHKLTLVSDDGYKIARNKNNPNITYTSNEVDSVNSNEYEFTSLRYGLFDEEKGCYYGEIIISGQLATDLGFLPGDKIPADLLEMVGIRIPTQDKHSMGYFKIVDILPPETGNQIILPADIIKLSGADFDIDSEFVRISEFYRDEKNRIRFFGDYKKSENPIQDAYQEYIEYIKSKDKRFKEELKSFKLNDPEYIELYNIVLDVRNQIETILEEKPTFESLKNFYTNDKKLDEHRKKLLQRERELELIVLNNLGYPSSIEKFEDEFKEQILENVKNFNEGKISQIKPLTTFEANNLLLEIEKRLIYNEGNKEIAVSPADDKLGTDFIEKYYNSENEQNNKKFENPGNIKTIASPTDVIRAKLANQIGKDNVGVAALWNVINAYLMTYKVNLDDGYVDSLLQNELSLIKIPADDVNLILSGHGHTLTKEGVPVRINHINSSQITFAVDNAKGQYAAYFNLTVDTLSPALLLTSKGMSFERAMLMVIQPAVQELNTYFKIVDSPIKGKLEESLNKLKIIDNIIENYERRLENINPTYLENLNTINLSIENLYEAKLFSEGKPSKLSESEFLQIQIAVLSILKVVRRETEQLRHFGTILSLIKWGKSDLTELNTVILSLEKIGIEIYQKPGTSGTKVEHFDLRYTEDFKTSNSKYPYHLLNVIKEDKLLYSNLRAFGLLLKDSEQFFITQTPFARNVLEKVKLSFKERNDQNILDYPENYKTLKNHFLAYIALKAYKKVTGKKFSFEKIFAEPKKLTRLTELYAEIAKHPELRKNHFVKYITPELTDYTQKGKENSIFYGLKLQKFVGQSRIKKSPDYQRILMDAFRELSKGAGFPPSSREHELAREFAKEAIEYLMIKDAGLFKNKSFIQQIEPSLFKMYSYSLTRAQRALTGLEKFEDVFGMSKEELVNEFIELFSRYEGNAFNLRSQSYKAMIGNVRQSKIDFIKSILDDKKGGNISIYSDLNRASDILNLLRKLGDSQLVSEINEVMPIKVDKETGEIIIDLYAGSDISKEDEEDVTDNQVETRSVVKSNFMALLSVGLFVPLTINSGNETAVRLGFPKFISINDDYKRQVYKLKYTKKSKNDSRAVPSKDYDFGYFAVYEPVERLGTKEVLPYAIDLADHESLATRKKLLIQSQQKEIEEKQKEGDKELTSFFKDIFKSTTKDAEESKSQTSDLKTKKDSSNKKQNEWTNLFESIQGKATKVDVDPSVALKIKDILNDKNFFSEDMSDSELC